MKKLDVKVKQMELTMIELKIPIKMFKIGTRMSPSIPLGMTIIILFDWRMEPS
jgi:hypothetical protein